MSEGLHEEHGHDRLPNGDELAARLFTLVMTGVCLVILGMIVFGDY